jgi:ABC-2 type transport system ATP-binding protein
MIAVEQLRKTFGSVRAVDGISFEIQQGEMFGLLGPNGAGKTTTIGMMMGLIRPDGGTVRINGNQDPRQNEVRQQLGVATQSIALYDELTAVENLRFFGKLYGLRGPVLAEAVQWALDFAELSERQKSRVATFSGGMKRRMNLACALLHRPRFVMMDEPTVGVDPQSRSHIFERIERIKAAGCTILYTTHYMEEAQRLCARIAIMDHGRILALDTPDGLIRQYGGKSVVETQLEQAPPASIQLPGRLEDLSLRFETTTPLEDIAKLSSQGIRFATLQLKQPDLESVFLALTGRSLRD